MLGIYNGQNSIRKKNLLQQKLATAEEKENIWDVLFFSKKTMYVSQSLTPTNSHTSIYTKAPPPICYPRPQSAQKSGDHEHHHRLAKPPSTTLLAPSPIEVQPSMAANKVCLSKKLFFFKIIYNPLGVHYFPVE